jgi:hypothetical protein
MVDYAWYRTVTGDDLEQGDMLRRCPVFLPPSELRIDESTAEGLTAEFDWVERDVVVLSQTCDLVKDREKVKEVLLCALWTCAEIGGHLATSRGMEDARRGNLPGYHMLAACEIAGFETEVAVVDFRRIYSLPLGYVRQLVSRAGDRIRLLPPYREHLAQAFARFFMRVGLPVDIPPFK